MKTFSFVHILLILVFLLAYQCTQAQDYAVTVRGDTLQGKIKLINYGPDKKAHIQPEGQKKETVPMVQTKLIFLDGEIYHPQKGPNGYAYMKLVKEGFLSIYAFQQDNQLSYDGLLLTKRDGSWIEVPNLNFKKAMKRFLDDCPSVAARIDSGDYGRRELEDIVQSYNQCWEKPAAAASEAPAPSPASDTGPTTQNAKTDELDDLEEKVQSQNDLPGKQDALDMIAEIRNKVKRGEKVPNFLVEGLRNSLRETSLTADAEEALNEIR